MINRLRRSPRVDMSVKWGAGTDVRGKRYPPHNMTERSSLRV